MGPCRVYVCISLSEEEYGVAFRTGSDLTAKLNQFLKDLKADGTLDELAKKYSLNLAEIFTDADGDALT